MRFYIIAISQICARDGANKSTFHNKVKAAYLNRILAAIVLICSAGGARSQTTATAAPLFSPASGGFHTVQTVTISDATAGAAIYYTTDGTIPTSQSTPYTGPITVGASENFSAIALAPGDSSSGVVKAWYTILLPTPVPVASPPAGAYSGPQMVTLTDGAPNATIYYSTNGKYPTTGSPVYSGPIPIASNTTLQAYATAPSYEGGPGMMAVYTIAATTPAISPASGTFAGAQTVTIADATPGAAIYYTTNGSTPTTLSPLYSGPLTVSSNEIIQAIAAAANNATSGVASATYTLALPTPTPTISPAAGTYTTTQTVAIACSNPGAVIYYTADGTTPTANSAVYSGPLTVVANETVSAMAVAAGSANSPIMQAAYTITRPAAAPTFSPAPSTYYAAQTVTMADATAGAAIYYTTDGTTPNSQSTLYAGPISVSASENFAAAALAPGGSRGPVTHASYIIALPAATPVASLLPGAYGAPQTLTLSDATSNAIIYFTTNGVYPTTSSPVYSGPFTISSNTQVQALATATGYGTSPVMSASYTIAAPPPVISPTPGTYYSAQTLTLTSSTPGVYFHYSTDGTTPTSSSPYYSAPFTVSANETVQAVAFAANYNSSAPASAAYTIILPTATPTISPAAGAYTSAQTVSLSCSNSSAVIYYTTNGSTPTTSSSVYSGPLTVSANETVSAMALASGSSNSATTQAAYTIAPPSLAPVFSPVSSAYYAVQTVTVTDTTPGATIYYTTNGATPTNQSTPYTGPITVSASANFSAIAVAPGGTVSPVVKAWYTITLTSGTPVASLPPGAYPAPQTVTLSDSTPNAVIYYTTNGKYPNTGSPVYGGPFIISSNTQVQALATATGYGTSAVMSDSYTIAAPSPVISPAPGTFYSAQTVALSTPTPGAYFHYTTDGSTPTSSSTYYSGPFKVAVNETVQAVAFATNYNQSAPSSAAYTIILPTATPKISPSAGTYNTNQTVSISCSNASAVLYYTLDGSTPTASSPVYAGPLTVSANETVSAMALASGSSNSPVTQAVYTITPPAIAPVVSPASGVYNTVQTITMTDATPGAVIYYSTNGTNPTTQSNLYTGPITVGGDENFFAVAIAPGGSLSPVYKAYFTVVLPTAVPVASPPPGTYSAVPSVTLTDATPGSTIYYTTNGSYPSTSSTVYTTPIPAPTGTQILAMATAPAYSLSGPLNGIYTVIAPPPSISPAAGTLQNTATVTITDAVPGATIYYSSDGSIPTTSSPVYTGPISLSPAETTTEVFHAMATATGYLPSSYTTATFTVDLPAGVLARTTVGTTPTMTIPANFMGISTNWDQPPMMMGQASTGVNTAFRTLLLNLTANSTAPMLIRIPGDDSTVANIQAAIEPLVELAQAVNVNYTLGVDLWNSNLSLAQAEASAWMTGVPNTLIQAIEIGNEPDVYPVVGIRPSTYKWPQYFAQFQQWQQGVNSTTGGSLNIMGPSMGGLSNWVPGTEAALAAGAFTPAIVSQHAYLGNTTQNSGQPWPADYLLQPYSAVQYPQLFTSFAAAAHQAGAVFRMDEIGSFYNGGVGGISNTFSSSLWAIDNMFNYVNDGFDGVNWITGQGTQYELFQFHPSTYNGATTFSVTQVEPIYYGLLVFSQMSGNNAQLLPVATTTTANVSIWATVDNTSTTHVVVINKDEAATGDVQITLPGYTTGTVRYLTAANYSAINGVTWGGQTFDGTPDGTIQGQPISTTINASHGVFTLRNMPITSAAEIDFSN